MNEKNKLSKIIARLILNTKRKKRPNNLIEIANDIKWLRNNLGSLEEVANLIGISSEMLRKFLSIELLSKEVKQLFETRKIDSVTIAHLITKFNNPSDQKIIAEKVMAGYLTADDMKVLVPLKNKLKNLDIKILINRVIESKNIKLYNLLFSAPDKISDINIIKDRFQKIVGKNEIVNFKKENNIITLELTKIGQKNLRNEAKNRKMTLRKLVEDKLLQ